MADISEGYNPPQTRDALDGMSPTQPENSFMGGVGAFAKGAANQLVQGVSGLVKTAAVNRPSPISTAVNTLIPMSGMVPINLAGAMDKQTVTDPRIQQVGSLGGLEQASQAMANKAYKQYPTSEMAGATAANLAAFAPLAMKSGAAIAEKLPNVIKQALMDTQTLASKAINATTERVGGDFAKVTPQQFADSITALHGELEKTKNVLYANRDALATKLGATVDRNNLQHYVDTQTLNNMQGATPEEIKALNSAKKFLGDGTPMDYKTAQQKLSSMRNSAYDLTTTNPTLARQFHMIADSMDKDISAAVEGNSSEELKIAHGAAKDFYANKYAPLQEFENKMGSIQDRAGLADTYALKSFTDNIHSSISPQAYNEVLKPEQRQMFQTLSIKSLQEAATNPVSKDINLNTYLKSMADKLQNDPVYKPIADKMNALSDLLTAHQDIKKAADAPAAMKSAAIYATAGSYLGGPLGGAAGAAVALFPRAVKLYTAGKMLADPKVAQLLAIAQDAKMSNPTLVENIGKLVMGKYNQYAATMNALAGFKAAKNAEVEMKDIVGKK